ncbi:unnamed protein product (macronuclear) [Paramecium tetraurelia]|uniref:Uncharacterized protein n=1 Tax=Paramecium tetraurelia TaxID=5888 RepID=A0DA77_PARTE|nr:uncharacterized protein GSPATT00014851001 [Paramecium tetraurelia]CAK79944.1 unnamed protein product [Paramecium tetraurelia]|eukprot:XP_001447341.1 hypothetical protein (macronuclear) [Paramecium tetraurelia strain d4-2]
MLNQENYKIQQFLVHLFNVDTSYSTCFHLTEPMLYQLFIEQDHQESQREDFTSFVEQYQMIYRKEFKPISARTNLNQQSLDNVKPFTYPSNSYVWIKAKQKKLKQQLTEQASREKSISTQKQSRSNQAIVYESLQLNPPKQMKNNILIQSPKIVKKGSNSLTFGLNSRNRNLENDLKQSLKTPQFKQPRFSEFKKGNSLERQKDSLKFVGKSKLTKESIPQSHIQRLRSLSGTEKLAAHQLIIGTINEINQLVHKMEEPKLDRIQSEESPAVQVPSRLGIVPAKLISIDVKKYKQ